MNTEKVPDVATVLILVSFAVVGATVGFLIGWTFH